ncbi:AsnC family transcriptional regulator [uncultured archaeon]|nr:AsnC family transcriptional regulator [uncultured archaeon]HKJ96727.1 Lrp/AsnC ligand binding domain-containing protein [Thermoplasmataceae archaeon]
MSDVEISKELDEYYTNKIVTALIGIEADVSRVEAIGGELAKENFTEDVFIVTGDYDIILKVRFPNYDGLQDFLVNKMSQISGIRGSKTMMVLTIKKDMGQLMGE